MRETCGGIDAIRFFALLDSQSVGKGPGGRQDAAGSCSPCAGPVRALPRAGGGDTEEALIPRSVHPS